MWTDDVERVLAPDYLGDLTARPLEEIRAMRAECRAVEDKVSYLRRLVQGRLDIVAADLRRRAEGRAPGDLSSLVERLAEILSDRVHAPGPGRLPTSVLPPDDPDLTAELDAVAGPGVLDSLEGVSDEEVSALANRLEALERLVSDRRKALFGRIDALEAELTRRYKTGEATVASVLG
jgi:hypothetical protein